ncbi:hypothetical protein GCM10025862_00050 [Arsenicicoccus piscis]|uniref:Ketoreductase (KR) domain-containing protein n=1 Tax=Arsenicicoccus piscis TaxID=673954 RepID=A0ABQ6HJU8_9MICO|nr:hypothetical protein GCM10025862_00050 [Arsenicicoccus piscis]
MSTAVVDVSSRESVTDLAQRAAAHGPIVGVIHAAGVSPSQASPDTILRVDLYGTALVLEVFGELIAPGGSGVVIASQSGHRLPALTTEEDEALAMTPTDELLDLPLLADVSDPCTLIRCRSAQMRCGSRLLPSPGVSGVRGTTASARGSSSRRSPATS